MDRRDFYSVESSPAVNLTSVLFYDLSHLTPEQFEQLIAALRAEGLLDDEE